MTAKQIRALDKSLYNSRNNLVGRKWSAQSFITRFQRYFPSLAKIDLTTYESRINMVPVYTDINKILRKRGMAIKSHKYCREFSVVEDAGKKVTHQRNVVTRITASANELNQGLFTFGGRYAARLTKAEITSFSEESSFRPGRIPY